MEQIITDENGAAKVITVGEVAAVEVSDTKQVEPTKEEEVVIAAVV